MSAKPRRVFDRDFKLQLCRDIASGQQRVAAACREFGICRSFVDRWTTEYAEDGEQAFRGSPSLGSQRQRELDLHQAMNRIAELEAALGRATLENELLQRAVPKGGSARRRSAR